MRGIVRQMLAGKAANLMPKPSASPSSSKN